MKLEQLVGRIDRIGQTAEEISIHYLAIEDSVHLENLRLMNERLVEYAKVQGAGRPLLPPELDGLKQGNHSEEVLRQLREATKQRALAQAATLDLSGFGNEQLPEEFELKPNQEVLESFNDALDKTVKKFGGEASEGRITFAFDRVCRSLLDSVNGEEGKLPQPHGDQLIVAADEFIPKDVHVHRWLLEQAQLDFQLPSGPMHGIGSPSAILRITTEGGEGFVGLAQEDGRWGLCSVHAVYTRLSKPTLSDKGRAFSDQNLDAINEKVSALGLSFASDTGRSDAQKRLRKLSLKQRHYD